MPAAVPPAPVEPTVRPLTARQRFVLALERAGHSHAEIATKMGLRHRQSATQLLQRARAAQKEFRAAVAEFIDAG